MSDHHIRRLLVYGYDLRIPVELARSVRILDRAQFRVILAYGPSRWWSNPRRSGSSQRMAPCSSMANFHDHHDRTGYPATGCAYRVTPRGKPHLEATTRSRATEAGSLGKEVPIRERMPGTGLEETLEPVGYVRLLLRVRRRARSPRISASFFFRVQRLS